MFFVYLLIEVVYVFDNIYLCQHIFVVDPEVNPLRSLAHYGPEERESKGRKL